MYENDLLDFIKKAVSPFHAVNELALTLLSNGYKELFENERFKITKGQKYFVRRNNSSIIAFNVGNIESTYGFNICASHSDSPTFKIKPNMDMVSANYKRINVEGYGGMLDATWFDRPLSVAGRCFVRKNGLLEEKLVNVDKSILTIPSLAIHLNREANSNAKYNNQVDMIPLFGDKSLDFMDCVGSFIGNKKEDIKAFDLFLYSRNRGEMLGVNNEFIQAPQLDDLSSAFASLKAFLSGTASDSINVFACFDNEEVGSRTRQGAASNFLVRTLERINNALNFDSEDFVVALDNSILVSADNAQAVMPNHLEKYDETNRTYLNHGVVIKYNADQSYTTDSLTAAIFKTICDSADAKYQEFTNRSDLKGGGTLGNISATHVSIPSVDIGLPQLAMHSVNETIGSNDLTDMIKALTKFYSVSIRRIRNEIIIK